MEHLVSTKTDPVAFASRLLTKLSRNWPTNVNAISFVLRDRFPFSTRLVSSLFRLYFARLRSQKLRQRREEIFLFGGFLLPFLLSPSFLFCPFVFHLWTSSRSFTFSEALSIFLSTSKYHFPSLLVPPLSFSFPLFQGTELDVSRFH